MQISIIGTGKVGGALALALKDQGYKIAALYNRTESKALELSEITKSSVYSNPVEAAKRGEIVFITTSDSAIQDMSTNISKGHGFNEGSYVFHTSGALSSHVLQGAKDCSAFIGSIHPLQSIPGMEEGVKNFPGTVFAIEGDEESVEVGFSIARALGGLPFKIHTEDKALYHAGACAASNYLVSTVFMGVKLLERAGIPQDKAMEALMPLIKGTCGNIRELGVPQALTGPISRGEVSTVKKHLDDIKKKLPEVLIPYTSLACYTVDVSKEKGSITEEQWQSMSSMLKEIIKGNDYK